MWGPGLNSSCLPDSAHCVHVPLVHVFSPRPVEGRVFLHKCMEAVGGFRLLVVAADALCCIFLLKAVEMTGATPV